MSPSTSSLAKFRLLGLIFTWSADEMVCPVFSETSTHTSVAYWNDDQLIVRPADEENSAPSSLV
ncbi:hypothetical protein SGLAM104S_02675 [Streptomyces glaucescens]